MKKRKQLRDYQKQACRAIVADLEAGKRPCISLFTALGKALVAAALCEWAIKKGYRVLMTVPNKTLVMQNYEECRDFISKPDAIGIVCKKLNKMENKAQVVIAMYQSFESVRATSGAFDLVITDEAHEVSNNPDSRYRKIFRSLYRQNTKMYFCGMSATVYRMGQGLLTNDCIKGKAFYDSIPYDSSIDPGIPALIDAGYLARLEVVNTVNSVNLYGVKMSGLEFNQSDAGVRFDAIIDDAVPELERGFKERGVDSALIFVSNIANGQHVIDRWTNKEEIALISSKETEAHNRNVINWLKNGTGKRYVVNVDMLTTGYNQTDLQAIVLLRATTSPGLLIQMIGRLIRPYGDKVGLIFDYGTNIERLGGIDSIKVPKNKLKEAEALKKYCLVPDCGEANHLGAKVCKACGAQFVSADDSGLYSMVTKAQALALKEEESKTVYDNITAVVPMLNYDKNGRQYLKLSFAQGYKTVHTENFMPAHFGDHSTKAKSMLLNWVKDRAYYAQLASVRFDCNTIYELLNNHEYLFKKFDSIKVIKRGRYVEILTYKFKDES